MIEAVYNEAVESLELRNHASKSEHQRRKVHQQLQSKVVGASASSQGESCFIPETARIPAPARGRRRGRVGCLIKPDGAGVSKLMLELLEEVLHEPGQLGCALEHTQRRCEPPAPPSTMAKPTHSWHSHGPRRVRLHHCDRCLSVLIPLPEGYDRNRYVVGIAEFGADQHRGLGHQADEARIGFGHRGPSLNRRYARCSAAQRPE